MKRILVVGTGLAGYTFARELRKLDNRCSLCMITADDGAFYSKPLLSNALTINKTPDQIATSTHEQMASQLAARIIPEARVSDMDVAGKTVVVGDETIPYDELVLCLGAQQRDAGLGPANPDLLHNVNNLSDYRHLRACLESAQRIAIVGTGLVGCEFANDIANTGRQVSIIGPGKTPLANFLPQQIGQHFLQQLEKIGIRWYVDNKAVDLEEDATAARLRLEDGNSIDTDLVITAIGLAPRIEFARRHGIEVNKGILVDDRLQTSQPHIYALGDCAEINGRVMPFVMPIMHSARVLAANITGKSDRLVLPYMPIIVKTPACNVIAQPAPNGIAGEWQISRNGDAMKGLYVDQSGQLQGFVLTGSATAERQALLKQLPPI